MEKSSTAHTTLQAYWRQPIDTGMLGCHLQTKARKHLQARQWGPAVKDYAAALEVADTMLKDPVTRKFAIERYLRTALELTYAMRKYKPETDVSDLIETVKQRLQPLFSPLPAEVVIAPLVDVAFSPIEDVDDWISMLFSYEASGQTMPH